MVVLGDGKDSTFVIVDTGHNSIPSMADSKNISNV
jgi:hypothetical protein